MNPNTAPNPEPVAYLDRRAHDQGLLAAGEETGWWDETGHPAPWPEDFWLADGTPNPEWTNGADTDPEEDPTTKTDGHPF